MMFVKGQIVKIGNAFPNKALAGLVTEILQTGSTSGKQYIATSPNNGYWIESTWLHDPSKEDRELYGWKRAVAAGETTDSLKKWRKDQKDALLPFTTIPVTFATAKAVDRLLEKAFPETEPLAFIADPTARFSDGFIDLIYWAEEHEGLKVTIDPEGEVQSYGLES